MVNKVAAGTGAIWLESSLRRCTSGRLEVFAFRQIVSDSDVSAAHADFDFASA
jgi:hypothetical protein